MRTTHSTPTRRRALPVFALALASIFFSQANAANFNVPAGDTQALADAIDDANSNPGYDQILLDPGTYWVDQELGWDGTALPVIQSNMKITVAGGGTATIRRSAAVMALRFFLIDLDATLWLERITLRGGWAGSGGAIDNDGTLVAERCVFRDNVANAGGAIWNDGSMSLDDCTVDSNEANGSDCGAVFNLGNAVFKRSTFTDNYTIRSGGAVCNTSYLRADNCTFSGNRANVYGGAIMNSAGSNGGEGGDLWLNNVTVTENYADFDGSGGGDGGGVYCGSTANAYARNSIIAGNFDNSVDTIDNDYPDFAGKLRSRGYNLIGNVEGLTILDDNVTNILGVDPMLAPLADNGGWTDTHALLNGSAAIDNGNASLPGSQIHSCDVEDQRGYSRAADGDGNGVAHCDIGAFELYANPYSPPGGGKLIPPGPERDPGKTFTATHPTPPSEPMRTSTYATR